MYRNKYRPKSFKTFIGNETTVKAIKANLESGVQLFLLHGERGCGKTTLARIIAKERETHKLDIHEINASNKTKVEDARDLEQEASMLPTFGKHKAYIIDEIHRMTGNAQDSLLKLFEEPPAHTTFVLCTTNPSKVLPTVRSRAFEHTLAPLDKQEIKKLLARVKKKEQLATDKKVIQAIVKHSNGIPREALSLLETVKDMKIKRALKIIKQGTEEDASIKEICQALIDKNGWPALQALVTAFVEDPEKGRRGIYGYLGAVADNSPLKKMKVVHYIQQCFEDPVFDNGLAGLKAQVREAFILLRNAD